MIHFSLRVTVVVFCAVIAGAAGQGLVVSTPIPVSYTPKGLAVADLLGGPAFEAAIIEDGADVVHVHTPGAGPLCGSTPVLSLSTDPNPLSVYMVDLQADGDYDVVSLNANSITVHLQDNETFVRSDLALASGGSRLSFADLDGDVLVEIILGSTAYFGTPTGVAPAVALLGLPATAGDFEPGDFDGDGDVDLAHESAQGGVSSIEVRLNDGSGAFPNTATTVVPSSVGATKLIAFRGNVDPRSDLLRVRIDQPAVELRLGGTNGVFTPSGAFTTCVGACPPDPQIEATVFGAGLTERVALRGGLNANRRLLIPVTNGLAQYGQSPVFGDDLAFGDFDGDGDLDALQHDANSSMLISWQLPNSAAAPPPVLQVESGADQIIPAGHLSQPLVVRVLSCGAGSVIGQTLNLSATIGTAASVALGSAVIEASGTATFPGVVLVPGQWTLEFGHASGSLVSTGLTVMSPNAVLDPDQVRIVNEATGGIIASIPTGFGLPPMGTLSMTYDSIAGPIWSTSPPVGVGLPVTVPFPITGGGGIIDFSIQNNLLIPIAGTAVVRPVKVKPFSPLPTTLSGSANVTFRVTDAAGVPIANQNLYANGTATVNGGWANVTNSVGEALVPLGGGTPGVAVLEIRLVNGGEPRFMAAFDVAAPRRLRVVSGDDQLVPSVGPFPDPIVFELTSTATGQVLAGQLVLFLAWSEFPGATTGFQFFPPSAVTDANGRVSVQVTAVQAPIVGDLFIEAAHFNTLMLRHRARFQIAGARASAVGPAFRRFHPGGPSNTYQIAVTSPSQAPLANESLLVTPAAELDIGGSFNVLTDSAGIATIQIAPGSDATPGVWPIEIDGQTTPCHTHLQAAISELTTRTGAGWMEIRYRHGEGPLPIAVVIDLPQPAPIMTPFGDVHTSILSPLQTFVSLDGTGLLGPLDPTVVAQPNFQFLSPLPTPPFGITAVVQVYAIDPRRPLFGGQVIISNPATVQL